jgi:hypothetical protein
MYLTDLLSSPSPSCHRCRPCSLLPSLLVDSTWRRSPRGGRLRLWLCFASSATSGNGRPCPRSSRSSSGPGQLRTGWHSGGWYHAAPYLPNWPGTELWILLLPLCFLLIVFNLVALILASSWFLISSGRSCKSAKVQYILLRIFRSNLNWRPRGRRM